MSRTVTFSPFTRVEGDLRMEVTIADGAVTEARAAGTLFRGFEVLLRGREPVDAIVVTCRICGQCGASHSAAAVHALAGIAACRTPPNGILCRNIIQAVEAILNNLTHFYLSFAADLAHPRYGDEMARRFAPVTGEAFRAAIRARRSFLAILGLFAGKWPNTLALQPGGTTKTMNRWEVVRARGVLAEFREFLQGRLLGGPLEDFLALGSAAEVDRWLGRDGHARSDLGRFISTALEAGLDRLGVGPPRFLAAGGYPQPDGSMVFASGYLEDGRRQPFDPAAVTEDIRYAWLEADADGRHPFDGVTYPGPEKPDAYTWAKAPRYRGRSAEVGPLARALVNAVPLAEDLVTRHGAGVYTRMLLRLRELFLLVHQVGRWLDAIKPTEPFCEPTPEIEAGMGAGLVAAPRGMLGHWVRVERGRIRNYQVVTPTGWNLSPRDQQGHPGPVEEALVGTPVDDDGEAVNVAHVVRSFDPCLFCTVH